MSAQYYNALTGQAYSEKNCELLEKARAALGCNDTKVAGFAQWRKLGRCVEKGQRGTSIAAFSAQDSEESVKKRQKRHATRSVFFHSQTIELDKKPEDVTAEDGKKTREQRQTGNKRSKTI